MFHISFDLETTSRSRPVTFKKHHAIQSGAYLPQKKVYQDQWDQFITQSNWALLEALSGLQYCKGGMFSWCCTKVNSYLAYVKTMYEAFCFIEWEFNKDFSSIIKGNKSQQFWHLLVLWSPPPDCSLPWFLCPINELQSDWKRIKRMLTTQKIY